ncbi:hypothetical protein L596_005345 [Steinernema carpocapsae]|uniref:Uncharacterized protein n=1 Tax=Steinernema carpocapsae TaxID=34508 RepID=A0A4U8UZV8_STECR|nr:hypothetical protein L596_005345 [Steinernema carpocapsae]
MAAHGAENNKLHFKYWVRSAAHCSLNEDIERIRQSSRGMFREWRLCNSKQGGKINDLFRQQHTFCDRCKALVAHGITIKALLCFFFRGP